MRPVPRKVRSPMKTKNNWLYLALALLVSAVLLISCSKEEEGTSDIGPHPQGWLDPNSGDNFHGWPALRDSARLCRDCHGATLRGAGEESGNSCYECHGLLHLDISNENTLTHRNLIVEAQWKINRCGRCHGADFTGGKAAQIDSAARCTRCHVPTNEAMNLNECNVCHTTDPAATPGEWKVPYTMDAAAYGAHPGHVGRAKKHCSECHPSLSASGHPHALPADVSFGRARIADTLGFHPTFTHEGGPLSGNGTCASNYCHSDGRAPNPGPPVVNHLVWNATPSFTCGACHEFPPRDPHPANRTCSQCHHNVDPASNFNYAQFDSVRFLADSLHVDGIVQF
jgi:predicted CxxxxCH...CXXCH cytochrome family protein